MRSPLPWLLLLALLAHGSGLANGFVYDDHRFVVENAALSTAPLSALVFDPGTQTADSDRDVYRPLRALGHAFDLRRWGPRPFGFHLHSLLVHLLNVALAFALLSRLLPAPAPGATSTPALLGATVLATHPLGVETVGWISSRGDLYALGFGLLALLCAVRAGPVRDAGALAGAQHAARTATHEPRTAGTAWLAWVTAGAVFALLATLGKESALWVPLVAWLAWRWLGSVRRAAVIALGLGVAAALVLRQVALENLGPSQTTPHGGDRITQAGWALYGTGRTLAALLWPGGLAVEYPQVAWAQGPPVWVAWPTLLALIAVVAVFVLRRRRHIAAVPLAWLLLAWLPSSSLLVTLRSLVNDRGSYPCLLAAGALAGVALAHRPARVVAGVAVLLALLLVPLSVQRTAVFRDDASLWTDALRADPRSVRAHLGLAQVSADPAVRQRALEQALAVAQPGSRLEGVAAARLGDFLLRHGADAAAALPLLQHSLAVQRQQRDRGTPGPDEAATAASLAECLLLAGQPAASDQVLEQALREQPGVVMLHVKRAALLLFRAERDQDTRAAHAAHAALAAAVALAPDHPMVRALELRFAELLGGGR